MTRKSIPGIALALTMVTLLAACSSSGASSSAAAPSVAAPTEAPSVAAPTEAPSVAAALKTYADLTVGFIQTGSESGWRAANTASFKETAEQLGITLKFYDAQNKLENQVSAFHQFNQDPSVNVIILAALDVTGYDDVLKEAKDAGKVVVLEDRRIDASPDLYYTYIGSDFALEGQKAAAAMCKLLEGSDKKNVVEISGAVGASAAIDRAKGFREKMGDCGITITETQTGDWNTDKSKAVMEAFLKKTKDIQGVFGHNDEEAIGAIQAIKDAGLVPGKDIQVIGVDATANGFKYLISGELGANIECNPLLGPQVYEAALAAVNGESLPKWVPSQEGEFFASQGADELTSILATRKY
jgi:galactofuranose transport system substrate-binding protein